MASGARPLPPAMPAGQQCWGCPKPCSPAFLAPREALRLKWALRGATMPQPLSSCGWANASGRCPSRFRCQGMYTCAVLGSQEAGAPAGRQERRAQSRQMRQRRRKRSRAVGEEGCSLGVSSGGGGWRGARGRGPCPQGCQRVSSVRAARPQPLPACGWANTSCPALAALAAKACVPAACPGADWRRPDAKMPRLEVRPKSWDAKGADHPGQSSGWRLHSVSAAADAVLWCAECLGHSISRHTTTLPGQRQV